MFSYAIMGFLSVCHFAMLDNLCILTFLIAFTQNTTCDWRKKDCDNRHLGENENVQEPAFGKELLASTLAACGAIFSCANCRTLSLN
jgi:hypothetical protein